MSKFDEDWSSQLESSLLKDSRRGLLVVISFVLVAVFCFLDDRYVFLDKYEYSFSLNGNHLKNNSIAAKLISEIKEHNDFLVLGTSESASSQSLYSKMLSDSKEYALPGRAVLLSGAGRSSNIWLSFFLAIPQSCQDLRVIYYLNPIYWEEELNKFNSSYYKRYISQDNFSAARSLILKNKLVEYTDLSYFMKFSKWYNFIGVEYLKAKFNYFRWNLFRSKNRLFGFSEELQKQLLDQSHYKKLYTQDLKLIDSTNALGEHRDTYISRGSNLFKISSDKYQTNSFISFIKISKKLGINLHVVIGPYNKILAKKYSPAVIEGYENLYTTLKGILIKNNIPYTDTWDLSDIPGTFLDSMHISKYAGFLTAKKVKTNPMITQFNKYNSYLNGKALQKYPKLINNDKIKVLPFNFGGKYGHGIKIIFESSVPEDAVINAFFKKDTEKNYTLYHKNIHGKQKLALDIHGYLTSGNSERNLEKGAYTVKLQIQSLKTNMLLERIDNVVIRY